MPFRHRHVHTPHTHAGHRSRLKGRSCRTHPHGDKAAAAWGARRGRTHPRGGQLCTGPMTRINSDALAHGGGPRSTPKPIRKTLECLPAQSCGTQMHTCKHITKDPVIPRHTCACSYEPRIGDCRDSPLRHGGKGRMRLPGIWQPVVGATSVCLAWPGEFCAVYT